MPKITVISKSNDNRKVFVCLYHHMCNYLSSTNNVAKVCKHFSELHFGLYGLVCTFCYIGKYILDFRFPQNISVSVR